MAKKVKVVLNSKGVKELLKSEEIAGACEEAASDVMHRAGAGYGRDKYVGKTRVNVAVYPVTEKARKDNLKNNTLLKALNQ